jgi:hypothetical protein
MDTKAIRVGPKSEVPNPTHHVSLEDEIGRKIGLLITDTKGNIDNRLITKTPVQHQAFKTASGNQKWSDFEPPWTPIAQDDWSGGRGSKDFDVDITRFADSIGINTTLFAKLFLNSLWNLNTGTRDHTFLMPGSVSWIQLITGSYRYLANLFIPSTSYSAITPSVLVRKVGDPTGSLKIELCSETTNNPGTVNKTATITPASITDCLSFWADTDVAAESLTSTTHYWIKVYSDSALDDEVNHWEVAVNDATGTSKRSANNTAWTTADVDLYYNVRSADSYEKTIPFFYKYALYKAVGTKVYINGDRGVADINAANSTLIDATKSGITVPWGVNEFAGCIVAITAGLGMAEPQRWRKIVSNTSTVLTVDTAWTLGQDTTTEYVILGAEKWREVATTGITGTITDVCVSNDIMYFPQGDAINIRRGKWEQSAGAEVYTWADDGTNKATYMCLVRSTTNSMQVWKGNNSDATSKISVARATQATSWANLTFGSAITMTDGMGRINGLVEYGETDKYLWVFREGTVQTISDTDKIDEIPLKEIRTMMMDNNGIARSTHNAYLYFNLGASLERYYSRNLDDVGPNRDEGLPTDRQGDIRWVIGYPGKYFIGIDGGNSGYSTVMTNNGTGWSETFRAPYVGQRITAGAFQPIPGTNLDRLWVFCGNETYWIGYPSNTIDPTKDDNMHFLWEGCLESGWIYANLFDAVKLFYRIKLFAEELVEDEQFVRVQYKMDDDSEWTELPEQYKTVPSQQQVIRDKFGVSCYRFKYRLILETRDYTKSPMVQTVLMEAISVVVVTYGFSFTTRLKDKDTTMSVHYRDELTGEEKWELLNEWAEGVKPLYMRSTRVPFDKYTVFLDPLQLSPSSEAEEYIATLNIMQII